MSYEPGSRKPKVGDKVFVVQKKDYFTGELTPGIVRDVLTSKEFHPRGHKVRLDTGIIGRVQRFADEKKEEALQTPTGTYTPAPDELV